MRLEFQHLFMKPRAHLAASALLLGLVGTAPAQSSPACLPPEVNVGQAKAFLAYLNGVASKTATAAETEAVLQQEGTELLIAQQNIARRVTAQQYRELRASDSIHLLRRDLPRLARSKKNCCLLAGILPLGSTCSA